MTAWLLTFLGLIHTLLFKKNSRQHGQRI